MHPTIGVLSPVSPPPNHQLPRALQKYPPLELVLKTKVNENMEGSEVRYLNRDVEKRALMRHRVDAHKLCIISHNSVLGPVRSACTPPRPLRQKGLRVMYTTPTKKDAVASEKHWARRNNSDASANVLSTARTGITRNLFESCLTLIITQREPLWQREIEATVEAKC